MKSTNMTDRLDEKYQNAQTELLAKLPGSFCRAAGGQVSARTQAGTVAAHCAAVLQPLRPSAARGQVPSYARGVQAQAAGVLLRHLRGRDTDWQALMHHEG